MCNPTLCLKVWRLNPSASCAGAVCNLCGGPSSVVCPSCDRHFCDACDDLYHRHPSRASHKREKIQKSKQGLFFQKEEVFQETLREISPHSSFVVRAHTCRDLQHLWAERSRAVSHLCPEVVFEVRPALSLPSWTQRSQEERDCCSQNLQVRTDVKIEINKTVVSEPPETSASSSCYHCLSLTSSPSLSPWECSHCTTVNEMQAVLCMTCERPRLATATVQDSPTQPSTSLNTGETKITDWQDNNGNPALSDTLSDLSEWQCKSCTVMNQGSSVLCDVCERPRLATRPLVAPDVSHLKSLCANTHRQVCVASSPLSTQHRFGHDSLVSASVDLPVVHVRQHRADACVRDVQPVV